jgi:plastocyanin
MKGRWFLLLMATVLLGAPACGGDEEAAPLVTTPPEEGGPQEFRVQIDADSDEFNAAFFAFLPDELAAHPGDTVTFDLPHFTGEPHTVTFGTLVDTAAEKLNEVGASISYSERENLPEMLKLTDVFPHRVGKGPPDVNQAAAAPCYLDTGEPPFPLEGNGPPCPKREQPEFNGRQTFYNSGVLQADGDSFSVKLAKDIAPGSYAFICLVHRSLMRAELGVADAKEQIPSPDEVVTAGKDQLEQMLAELKAEANEVAAATPEEPVAGSEAPSVFGQEAEPSNAEVAEFGPKELSVAVGESITWTVRFFHTVSINAPEEAVGGLTKAPDGSFHLNPGGIFPAESPLAPEDYLNFPPTTDKPITIDGKSFTGAFKSSGLLGSIPPALISYKVSFPKAGTYTLRCLFHPDMKGQIKVG